MTTASINRSGAGEVLGRYSTPAGTRTLYARRKGSWTYITDEPATPRFGRVYLVEEIPDADGVGAVAAVAQDYLSEAARLCSIPMAHTIMHASALAVAA
jgi:hypothetical protein